MNRYVNIESELGIPCLVLSKSEKDTNSYLGGLPSVGCHLSWPRNLGKPLTFLAQVDLGEVNKGSFISWLPNSGRLLFFYDAENSPWGFDPKNFGGWAVIYDQSESGAERILPPNDLSEELVIPEVKFLVSTEGVSIPSMERAAKLIKIENEYDDEEYFCHRESIFNGEARHKIGGFPDAVQGDDMELQCQLVSGGVYCGNSKGYSSELAKELKSQKNDWRLLFQIDTDDDLEMMWGDVGILYFWVRESDAKNCCFDKSWVILQCS